MGKQKQQYELESKPIIEESITAGGLDATQTPTSSTGELPCSVNGLMSAAGGGALGYVFGFGRQLFISRKMSALHAAGWESASAFGLIGGLYAMVSCFCVRLRRKEDAWNGGIAGCATGLALGWKGGPVAAVQNCIGFGVLSAFFDNIGKEPESNAMTLDSGMEGGKYRVGSRKSQRRFRFRGRCGKDGCEVPFGWAG